MYGLVYLVALVLYGILAVVWLGGIGAAGLVIRREPRVALLVTLACLIGLADLLAGFGGSMATMTLFGVGAPADGAMVLFGAFALLRGTAQAAVIGLLLAAAAMAREAAEEVS